MKNQSKSFESQRNRKLVEIDFKLKSLLTLVFSKIKAPNLYTKFNPNLYAKTAMAKTMLANSRR